MFRWGRQQGCCVKDGGAALNAVGFDGDENVD